MPAIGAHAAEAGGRHAARRAIRGRHGLRGRMAGLLGGGAIGAGAMTGLGMGGGWTVGEHLGSKIVARGKAVRRLVRSKGLRTLMQHRKIGARAGAMFRGLWHGAKAARGL